MKDDAIGLEGQFGHDPLGVQQFGQFGRVFGEERPGELPLILGSHALTHAPKQLLHLARPFADQDFASSELVKLIVVGAEITIAPWASASRRAWAAHGQRVDKLLLDVTIGE